MYRLIKEIKSHWLPDAAFKSRYSLIPPEGAKGLS